MSDELLDVGGDGTAAAVVLVVALARETADEVVLDGSLQVVRHVVVHAFQAEGHADLLAGAVLRTAFLLHPGVAKMDGHDRGMVLGDIVLQDTAKTMLADGAMLALADSCFCR